jgi:hypothetical protein
MVASHARLLVRVALVAVLVVPVAAAGQDILFSVSAQVAGLSAPAHIFGFAVGALTGLDTRDVPEPPHAPSGYLALAFRMPYPAVALPNRWRDDLRATDDFLDRAEIWELHLECDLIGATCTFGVTPPANPPCELHLRVIGVDDGEGFVVPSDGVFTLVIHAPDTAIWLELTADKPIPVVGATWGAVRRLYTD